MAQQKMRDHGNLREDGSCKQILKFTQLFHQSVSHILLDRKSAIIIILIIIILMIK